VSTNRIDTISLFHPLIDSIIKPTGFDVWIASCGPVDLTFATEEEAEAFFVGGLRKLREAQGVTMPTEPLVGHIDDTPMPSIEVECTVEVRDLTPGDLVQLRGRWLEVVHVSPAAAVDGALCVAFHGGTGEYLMPGDAVKLGRRVEPFEHQPREHSVPCRGCSTPSHPVMTLNFEALCDGCRERQAAKAVA